MGFSVFSTGMPCGRSINSSSMGSRGRSLRGRACWLMRMDRRVLVTGATGYIASRLIPRLLAVGYQVRCLARDPRRLAGRRWFSQVEIVQGDVTIPSTLIQALDGVHSAYYLIHNMSHG